MGYKSIKKWPENERPRERLLKFGASDLSTAQLLAIVLRTGGKNKNAIELAREILMQFPDLRVIEDASVAEFAELRGIGAAKVAQIKAALELGKRSLKKEKTGIHRNPQFKSSRQVYNYYMPEFHGLKKERFLCSLLDVKNRVFKSTIVSEGTLTASLVHPREVFRYAIKEAAASVLFIHNHPSGDPSPSKDDIDITKRLVETGQIIGIQVVDHIIIGDGKYITLMDKKFIKHM
jgi:DNA repair protein RadC